MIKLWEKYKKEHAIKMKMSNSAQRIILRKQYQQEYDKHRNKTKKRQKELYELNANYRKNNRKKLRVYHRDYKRKNYKRDRAKTLEAKKRYRLKHPYVDIDNKKRQIEKLMPSYVNQLLREKGIPINRSKQFNETFKFKIKVNRLLKKIKHEKHH